MREIKFRGQRVDDKQWVCGYYTYEFEMGYCSEAYDDVPSRCSYISNDNGEYYEVIPSTIGQYTGLKDKNGQMIFEGDIISYLHDDWIVPEAGVVKYMSDDGYPAFELEHSPVFDDEHYVVECNMLALLDQPGDYSYFVDGNIHDNPEVMGGTK